MITHLKYLRAVLRHKRFVFAECCRLGIPWLGIIHDLSKFRPGEWFGYARHFYGKYPKFEEVKHIPHSYSGLTQEDVKLQFDRGWLHHQHSNKHHWQRWVLRNESEGNTIPLPMPEKYIREMVADWRGAGRAYGNPNTREWYLGMKDRMLLHESTRNRIEELLGVSA